MKKIVLNNTLWQNQRVLLYRGNMEEENGEERNKESEKRNKKAI